jgi:uncharacterized protein YjeT (DUF2065 family)
MWQELMTAFCLMLILEGMIPFLYPDRWKNVVKKLADIDSRSMRMMGLASMLIGALSLYLVR